MQGCPACEEYMPRFKNACSRNPPSCPVGVYDLASDPRANEFATRLGIRATPTTVVMDRRGKLHKFVGALADSKILQILKQVVT
jgi:thioredoxin-like negative regulator of GroEL